MPPHQTYTGSPLSLQGTAMPGTVAFPRAHKPGLKEEAQLGPKKQDHGTRAAGSGQEVCSCIRAGGWSHIFPAALMQTDCRPTPEPNAAARWVKNSLSTPPTPFSDGLFLTQNIYGFGLPQSPHPIAPTRMRAFKKKKPTKKKKQLHH